MKNIPTFGIDDIPDDWWIRLNDDFVDELDRLNRPWPHEKGGYGKKRGRGRGNKYRAKYWEAGQLHKRTLERMPPDEVERYKRRHSFFEKLWGRHRWKDYHFAADDPRRYVDTGPWITKSDISVLREGVIIEDSELERGITGFRVGKFSDNVRELRFPRLPIVADKWWAWTFGFYFGAGNIYSMHRVGPRTRSGGWASVYIRFRLNDEVVPRFMEVSRHTGSQAVLYTRWGPKFRGKKETGLKAGTREQIVFGWPEFVVLKKFGLPTEFIDELEDRKGLQMASSGYKPTIPSWIKDNDDLMRAFIEGYLSTGKARSALFPAKQRGKRLRPYLQVILVSSGMPEEYVKQFLTDIYFWFARKGHLGLLVKEEGYKTRHPDRVMYELFFTDRSSFKFILENFDLVKSDLRARIFVMCEAEKDKILFEALRVLKTPDNVVLGLLLEQPLTETDINELLMMKKEGVSQSLRNLMNMGLIIKRDDHYVYYPKVFAENTAIMYEERAEDYLEKMETYLNRLLYQCKQCRHVYIKKISECSLCGGEVNGVPRLDIVGKLGRERMYDMYLARGLRGEKE